MLEAVKLLQEVVSAHERERAIHYHAILVNIKILLDPLVSLADLLQRLLDSNIVANRHRWQWIVASEIGLVQIVSCQRGS